MNCYLDCKDWIILIIGFGFSIFWALLIYSLRPKIKIGLPEISTVDNKSISIPVSNLSSISKVTRLLIEVAVIENDKFTYHLKTDIQEFAFLPSKKKGEDAKRVFKAFVPSDYLSEILNYDYEKVVEILKNPKTKLRVRIHASHSFSGLGKSFENHFDYQNNTFKQILN